LVSTLKQLIAADRRCTFQSGASVQTETQHTFQPPGRSLSKRRNVLRYLNPVLVVDESHNAESDLSVDMLKNLNPSFILDLTATPKDNSNIISLFPTVAKNLHTHVIDRKEIKRGKALYVSNSNEDSNLLF